MPTKPKRPKIYTCSHPDCGKRYNRPILLRQHENSHSNNRPFKCTEEGCDKAFFKKSNLQDHMYSHLPVSARPYACTLCEKKFISLDRLRRHELTHTDRYKCPREDCTRAFSSHQGLKHHIQIFHDRVLNCDVCNKVFQLPRLVKQHRIKKHSEIPSYACQFSGCYSVFADEFSLNTHVCEKHPQFECEVCAENCLDEKSLKIHMSVHHDISARSSLNNDTPFDSADAHNGGAVRVESDQTDPEVSRNSFTFDSENISLQTLHRSSNINLNVEHDESQVPKIRGQKKIEKSLPLPESAKSIIDIVSRGSMHTFTCPYKSCRKTYVRQHFYDKHLKKHLEMIEKAEERAKGNEDSHVGRDIEGSIGGDGYKDSCNNNSYYDDYSDDFDE